MRKVRVVPVVCLLQLVGFLLSAQAQTNTGNLELTARLTPTAAKPEPVRQFTFYILTRSYTEIAKEIEAQDVIPSRDQYIDALKLSPELIQWLKAHDVMDLTAPGLDKVVTPDEILQIPEFLLAYQRSNSGGVTYGLPKPKYKEAEKETHPEKYAKEVQEYHTALKKFMQAHPETVSGMELELEGINPQTGWAKILSDHRNRIQKNAPEVAQMKYLATRVDTDLEGHASVRGLPAGNYWITSLNLDVTVGDSRVRWDVPVRIQPGQVTRIDLTNLNGTDTRAFAQAP